MSAIRLQRYLAQAGVAARRKAETLIEDGAVAVNGKVVTELGTRVDPDRDHVTVEGRAVRPEPLYYVILNKPKGCVTTVSDPHGRPTVMEYLPGLPGKVVPVGRLDFYSEGVLLLTNDGDLAAALMAPRTHAEKTYHVKIRGPVKDSHIAAFRTGVTLDRGVKTRPAEVNRLAAKSRHTWLVMTLTEGKNRQIHRMAEAFGYQVLKIQRVAFAGLTFHGLRVGDARELTQQEVAALYAVVGQKPSARAQSRGKWSARREQTDMARRARTRQRDEEGAPPPPQREPRPAPSRMGSGKPPARTGRPASRAGKPPARAGKPPARTSKPPSRTGSKPPSRTSKPPARATKPASRTTKPKIQPRRKSVRRSR